MEPSSDVGSTPAPPPGSFWARHGCYITFAVPFLLAIPVWLVAFPDSYDRAVEFVCDALATLGLGSMAVLVVRSMARHANRPRPIGYLFGLVIVALAGLAVWNMLAVYARAGLAKVIVFDWQVSTHPWFYGLVLIAVAFLLLLVGEGLKRLGLIEGPPRSNGGSG